MTEVRILPSGDRALLAEYDSLDAAMGAFAALDASAPAGVIDLVPAARTVLVTVDPTRLRLADARRWIAAVEPVSRGVDTSSTVTIPVDYDGEDLAEVAELLGLSPEALVTRHAAAKWRCAFIGFAPGFSYLVSDGFPSFDGSGAVPRRSTSRQRVRAGSVGLAGEFSGVYPRESPGGWQLIGRTDAPLWDPTRDSPALIPPGTTVRFEAR